MTEIISAFEWTASLRGNWPFVVFLIVMFIFYIVSFYGPLLNQTHTHTWSWPGLARSVLSERVEKGSQVLRGEEHEADPMWLCQTQLYQPKSPSTRVTSQTTYSPARAHSQHRLSRGERREQERRDHIKIRERTGDAGQHWTWWTNKKDKEGRAQTTTVSTHAATVDISCNMYKPTAHKNPGLIILMHTKTH